MWKSKGGNKVFELKAGQVVEFDNGELAMVTYGRKLMGGGVPELCLSGEMTWFPAYELNDELEYDNDDDDDAGIRVTKVYGFASNMNAHRLEISDRKLIWEKTERKTELTVQEIEEKLGYAIKIVE